MKIFVTGANGQLGTELRRIAPADNNKWIFTDIAELDISDADAVASMVAEVRPDVIVNCAAYTNVDKAEDDEACADRINRLAVANLAQAARHTGATLIHISTDYVFNGEHFTPYREDDRPSPIGAYGRTKYAGEQAVAASGCKSIIIRTAWLYSAHGNNFVKTMMRLTDERDSLGVVVDQIGTPTSATDLADAIFHIISRGMLGKTGVYHFTDAGVASWYDFAVAIAHLAGNECDIRPILSAEYPSKVTRPHYSVLDKSLFIKTFGYNHIPHWTTSLSKVINELK